MTSTLDLKALTLPEKLKIMEDLWEDLRVQHSDMPSPPWHKEVLSERSQKIERGEASFTDWDEAKVRIRERCHEGQNS